MSNAASSTIEVNCPQCGMVLSVPSQFAGKKGRCSGCQNVFLITAPVPSPFANLSPAATPASGLVPLRPNPAPLNPQAPPPVRTGMGLNALPATGSPPTLFDDDDFKLAPMPSSPALPSMSNPYSPPNIAINSGNSSPYGAPNKPNVAAESGWKMIGGGVLMMVGAVVWFVAGLFFDRIFFYPPVLFILGIVGCVRGMIKLGSGS